MSRAIRFLTSISLAATLASCDLIRSLPVISPDFPVLFSRGTSNVLNATIAQRQQPIDPALTVTCLLTLQTGPNRFDPLPPVTAVRSEGLRWRCPIPATLSLRIRANQMIRVEWQVTSPNNGGTPLMVAQSQVQETIADCGSLANRDRAYRQMQVDAFAALPRKIDIRDSQGRLPPPTFSRQDIESSGYVPTHGATSFGGMGVAFIRQEAAGAGAVSMITGMNFGQPQLAKPDLLLFRPNLAGSPNVLEVSNFDEPYTLIGWAYAQTIGSLNATPLPPDGQKADIDVRPEQRRPVLRCVPHHEWFIHADGVHRGDGSFAIGRDVGNFLPPVHPSGLPNLPHNAIWDVHFFINPSGTPDVGIVRSGLPGIPVSPLAFYYPTAYDQ
jgi:hypothetical protein